LQPRKRRERLEGRTDKGRERKRRENERERTRR
jgi:hypothetical protein